MNKNFKKALKNNRLSSTPASSATAAVAGASSTVAGSSAATGVSTVVGSKNNETIDDISKIVYNYYNTTIFSNSVSDNAGNYAIDISYPTNSPNLLYPDSLGAYTATKFYLCKTIHTDIDTYDKTNTKGELIIEHTGLTNGTKLYLCILLNYNSSINTDSENDIDKLITVATTDSDNKTVSLNNSISTQDKAFTYTDNGNQIIVFNVPMFINRNSSSIINKLTTIPSDITFSTADDYVTINPQNIYMSGKDEIYIDCSPTGASAEEIATYNVPINSEYTQDAGKLDFMKTTIQLCLVFLLIVVTYFSVPFFYKTIVVDNIKKLLHSDIEKKNRNTAIDIMLIILSVLLLIHITYNGVVTDNFDSVLIGVYFFVIFGLSVAIIGYNRQSNYFEDAEYRNAGSNTNNNAFERSSIIFLEIIKFLKDSFVFTLIGPRTGTDTIDYKNIINIIGLYSTIILILVILCYATKTISSDAFKLWLQIMAVLITFGVTIVSLINKTNSQSSYDNQYKFI